MRPTLCFLLGSVACALGVGCRMHRPPEGLDLLALPIDTSISLSGWLNHHPHDISVFDAPAGSANEYICRTAELPVPVDGATMRRYALFYIPDAPPGEVFPTDTANFAGNACNLRAMWLVREVNDSAMARLYADTLAFQLSRRLGPGQPGAEIAGLGTGAWQHTRTWHTGSTRVVLGVERTTHYRSRETGNITERRPQVIVAAYTPHSGLSPATDKEPSIYGKSHYFLRDADDKLENDWIDSVLALPGIPPAVVDDLRDVIAYTRSTSLRDSANALPSRRHSATIDSAMARAIIAARDTVAVLPPPTRAATMLAADLVLNRYAGILNPGITSADTATLRAMRAAGVGYVTARGPVVVSPRPWLWTAYRTDSLSPAGRIAFLDLLSNGWTTLPDCEDGRDGYARVINHGESALRAGNTDPLIHFFVGEGYRDIYSLAHGGGGTHADASDFASVAEVARHRAIEHLVTALRSLRQQPVRHAAWDDAIRLVLGAHTETSFFCFY